MKFTVNPIRTNITTALRRAGYIFQHHVDTGEMSFVKPMGRGGYPRYHMYVTLEGAKLDVSIHIDHKRHTHGDATRHHGEYEDDGALGPEVERLKRVIR